MKRVSVIICLLLLMSQSMTVPVISIGREKKGGGKRRKSRKPKKKSNTYIGCAPGYGIVGGICKPCKEIDDHGKPTTSPGGKGHCEACPSGSKPNAKHSRCVDRRVEAAFKTFEKKLIAQKEKTNDLSIKNSRLWQKEQIRLYHDKLMQERKEQDDKNEEKSCEHQRNRGTVIFPAIEISIEIEDKEDTTCIDTNRDELLKSFCSFRMDLDNLFQIQNIDKEAKSFWPNICCKERRDTTLEICEDPSGNLNRGEIVPFALSQGGHYSRHNLYVEVTDTIKYNGYLHKGMKKLLLSLGKSKTRHANKLVNSFFKEVSLCGPRIINEPGAKEKKKLCELFIPYQHSMTEFYNLIEHLLVKPMKIQSSSFLETIESKLLKRQLSRKGRIGKNNKIIPGIGKMMQTKSKSSNSKTDDTCKPGIKFGPTELAKKKEWYCQGSNHLDLSTTNIKNIAIHFLKNDISPKYRNYMINLKESLRYDIKDDSCPAAPLFTAEDISIQQVNMDTLGKEKEWVAVVHLNTKEKNGYLQSELPYCEDRKYLIGAKVEVKAYIDDANCCKHIKDYKECEDLCGKKLMPLKDKRHKYYSKDVVVTGTQYTVDNSYVSRRRRLLQYGRGGC